MSSCEYQSIHSYFMHQQLNVMRYPNPLRLSAPIPTTAVESTAPTPPAAGIEPWIVRSPGRAAFAGAVAYAVVQPLLRLLVSVILRDSFPLYSMPVWFRFELAAMSIGAIAAVVRYYMRRAPYGSWRRDLGDWGGFGFLIVAAFFAKEIALGAPFWLIVLAVLTAVVGGAPLVAIGRMLRQSTALGAVARGTSCSASSRESVKGG